MKNFNTQPGLLPRFRLLFVVALMLVVAACSSVRFAYNQGDTVLYWWINNYLDLDSDQSDLVKQDIGQLFAWHRKTQLQDYGQLLGNAKRDLASGTVTMTDLKTTYGDIRKRTEVLAFKALPELAELALSLKPDQIATMEKKFNKNNETFRKKFIRVDNEKKLDLRYKKSMEQFELWFGNFSKEQEVALRKVSDARPLNNELWLEERILRQKKILAAMREIQQKKLGKEATQLVISNLLKDIFSRMDAPPRKAFFDAYNEGTMQMIMTAIQVATPAQKAHAQKRMQGWIDDFKVLAADTK